MKSLWSTFTIGREPFGIPVSQKVVDQMFSCPRWQVSLIVSGPVRAPLLNELGWSD